MSEDYLKKLNEVFQYAYHHKKVSLYRDLYQDKVSPNLVIDSIKKWRELPFITKADLLRVPLLERTFTEPGEAFLLRSSSGTSGNQVLMTLRRHHWTFESAFKHYTPTGVLVAGDESYGIENAFRMKFPDIPYISVTEYSSLELAVKLAAELPINTFGGLLQYYNAAIPLLQKYGLAEKMELVYTAGERVTTADYNKIKSAFPRAKLHTRYGATEIHDNELGTSVDDFEPGIGSRFLTKEVLYMELVDTKTGEVIEEVNRPGEIVVTMLWTEKNPSPLLRYKMGDLGMYLVYQNDPKQRVYTTLGRLTLDKLSVPGGFIQTLELERVVGVLNDEVEGDFELHYLRNDFSDKKFSFELWVIAKNNFNENVFLEKFMSQLRIAPELTFKQAVDLGLLEPLKCKMVDKLSRDGKKSLRLIEDK